MGESTLSVDYGALVKVIGNFVGYGRDSTKFDSKQSDDVEEILQSGYRQFLYPPPLPGSDRGHEWTFLKPVRTLSTVAATGDYDLPDDFGGIEGPLTFEPDEAFHSIRIVGEAWIREKRETTYATGGYTGRPPHAAVQVQRTDGSVGQRYKILFWPEPDGAYDLTYKYLALPGKLTSTLPYPYGGMAHAETLIESCLSVAESRLDDEFGLHNQLFLKQLGASISIDSRHQRAEFLGYNKDGSDGRGLAYPRSRAVTFDSTLYP